MTCSRKQLDQRRLAKIKKDLGLTYSASIRKLTRAIMFSLIQKTGLDTCYRCSGELLLEDFSIEHKKVWRNQPDAKNLFFDLNNISFSHQACNTRAAKKGGWNKGRVTHGTSGYRSGCRCETCKTTYSLERRCRYKKIGK